MTYPLLWRPMADWPKPMYVNTKHSSIYFSVDAAGSGWEICLALVLLLLFQLQCQIVGILTIKGMYKNNVASTHRYFNQTSSKFWVSASGTPRPALQWFEKISRRISSTDPNAAGSFHPKGILGQFEGLALRFRSAGYRYIRTHGNGFARLLTALPSNWVQLCFNGITSKYI